MRISAEEHLKNNWRVSTLAPDFDILDVWRYPVEIEEHVGLDRFVDFMQSSQRERVEGRGAAGFLFRLRGFLGKAFGWDGDGVADLRPLPIPGCEETTLFDRLSDAERAAEARSPHSDSSSTGGPNFIPVYSRENESLREISNSTVHALLHLGRVSTSPTHWSPQLAVYVKTRGVFGRYYMAAISPFRHYIVYPTMMRAAERGWPKYAAQHLTD